MNENGNKPRSARTSGKRACLCKDGKYRRKCCTGELQNQGIGGDVTIPQPPAPNWNPLP